MHSVRLLRRNEHTGRALPVEEGREDMAVPGTSQESGRRSGSWKRQEQERMGAHQCGRPDVSARGTDSTTCKSPVAHYQGRANSRSTTTSTTSSSTASRPSVPLYSTTPSPLRKQRQPLLLPMQTLPSRQSTTLLQDIRRRRNQRQIYPMQSSRATMMIRLSPKWWIGDGTSGISISFRRACGRSTRRIRTFRRRKGRILKEMFSSSREGLRVGTGCKTNLLQALCR